MSIMIHGIADQDGYFVTEDGRIFKEKVPTKSKNGYRQVSFRRGDPLRYVHEIVLTTFRGQRPEKYDASHLNGDKLDNRLDNLVWESRADNMRRMHDHGTMGQAKLTEDDVRHIRDPHNFVGVSKLEMAEKFGVCPGTIEDVINRNTWRHI